MLGILKKAFKIGFKQKKIQKNSNQIKKKLLKDAVTSEPFKPLNRRTIQKKRNIKEMEKKNLVKRQIIKKLNRRIDGKHVFFTFQKNKKNVFLSKKKFE